jgi:hypothetical protein
MNKAAGLSLAKCPPTDSRSTPKGPTHTATRYVRPIDPTVGDLIHTGHICKPGKIWKIDTATGSHRQLNHALGENSTKGDFGPPHHTSSTTQPTPRTHQKADKNYVNPGPGRPSRSEKRSSRWTGSKSDGPIPPGRGPTTPQNAKYTLAPTKHTPLSTHFTQTPTPVSRLAADTLPVACTCGGTRVKMQKSF